MHVTQAYEYVYNKFSPVESKHRDGHKKQEYLDSIIINIMLNVSGHSYF